MIMISVGVQCPDTVVYVLYNLLAYRVCVYVYVPANVSELVPRYGQTSLHGQALLLGHTAGSQDTSLCKYHFPLLSVCTVKLSSKLGCPGGSSSP